ncbi:YceI family protein [Salinimicrobium sp. GXAS 041]|uniref:YceI family protein n=1 Tax=Salinimicrobium sp. GXAS 041 TaxID=3400806 RepID=UPI003C774862
MRTSKQFLLVLGSFLMMVISIQTAFAQNFNINRTASELKIEGTSNIHDWEIEAEEFQGNINVEIQDGQLVKVNELNFAVVAESLKSGKRGMDKNTYKALKTDDNQRITFQLSKINDIDCTTNNKCKVSTSGYLTIAGTKKPVDIIFDATVNQDKIVLSGNKNINMTHFNVEPPTAMFGTITTGDEVKINFKTTFSR